MTVKLHRSSLMRKMEVHTVADLVRLSQDLKSQAQA
ncbi:MAG: LuxR C-terminal-related transcriptional regulator [Phenylobacterium sp.]|nr:LuxR C-terminal-related transcriptional regulator [Phenylobacterium sp.]